MEYQVKLQHQDDGEILVTRSSYSIKMTEKFSSPALTCRKCLVSATAKKRH